MYGPSADLETASRRTLYSSLSRTRSTSDVLKLYDVPQPMQHIPMRYLTINPLQALFVMNSPFVREQASALAAAAAASATAEDKITLLYRKVFARDPQRDEIALGVDYLKSAGVPQYAQALLSANEVIFWP
jgi:hypothetical protein